MNPHTDATLNADTVRLLRDARDLLWHDLREARRHADDCPGCTLEAEIDAHLDDLGANEGAGPAGADVGEEAAALHHQHPAAVVGGEGGDLFVEGVEEGDGFVVCHGHSKPCFRYLVNKVSKMPSDVTTQSDGGEP